MSERRQPVVQSWMVILCGLLAALALWSGSSERSRARAEEGFQGGMQLVTTGGVVSSNGTTAVALLAIPGGYTAPGTHRFWVGGMTLFNTDTASHTVALISHHSLRVIWEAPVAASSGVILDNVNMLASDQGTTAAPEGVDMILENGGGTKVGAVGQGYYK